ncbi:MAG TPA: hypothetical protein VFZ56_09995 [Gemmatimonadaceae bacterium]
MLHLPADRLAELVDVEPTPQELAHLQSCDLCARERQAFCGLRELAASARDHTSEPLTTWETLRPVLASEGLISATVAGAAAPVRASSRRFGAAHWGMRLAASFLLVAAGVAAGRMSAPAPASVAAETVAGVIPAGSVEGETVAQFASEADAMSVLLRAQQDYQRAAAYLLATDTTMGTNTPVMFKQRLAALDELMGVTRSALSRAPQDPVINSYYLAALGAREATLQQLDLALPEGTKIDRF